MKNISLDWILRVKYFFVGFMVFGWYLKEIFGILNIIFRKYQTNILRQTR